MTYTATIEVDTELIRDVTGNRTASLRQLIRQEFDWLESSGIELVKLQTN